MGSANRVRNGCKKIVKRARYISKKPVFIAVDGFSAAGKSTLARELASKLGHATVVHTDDFYRVMDERERFNLNAKEGCERYYDWQRLEQTVLKSLSAGKAPSFRSYDWQNNCLGESMRLEPADYIVVEGCYAARPELSHYFDIIVFVSTPASERRKRQAARNNASTAWLERWEAAESYYISTTRLTERADIVLSTV